MAIDAKGEVKCTFGMGSFMLLHIGAQPLLSKHKLLTTIAWSIGGRTEYALEGSMLMAGAVQWLRDGLRIIRSSAEVEALAQTVADPGGVVLVPAFSGLGAPHWAQHARGVLPDRESIARQWQTERVFEPKMDEAARREKRMQWHKALGRSGDWSRDWEVA